MSETSPAHVAHADHGSNPAAWTLVAIITLAFVVGTLGVMLANWTMFWVGAALVPVGVIVGLLLKRAGFGKKSA